VLNALIERQEQLGWVFGFSERMLGRDRELDEIDRLPL
jgi:hypothetical protein